MAATIDTSRTVTALLSTFRSAIGQMKQISKKTKKKKSEQALKQKWLLETLETGEQQISQRYNQYLEELGERFKIGDVISRDRLQNVVINMQAELSTSLQMAIDMESAILDAGKLQEDALFHRRDALSAFDELKQRIQEHSPNSTTTIFSQMVPAHHRNSIPSPSAVSSPTSESFPPGVTFPEEESGRRMSRLFSMRSRPHKRTSTSSSTIANMVVAPNLNWLGPVQAEPEKYELAGAEISPSRDPSPMYGDIKVPIPEPDTQSLHPAFAKQTSILRHASTSTYSSDISNQTRNSAFSDEKIPVLNEDPGTPMSPFPDASEIAAALPPDLYPDPLRPAPLNFRPKNQRASSASAASATLLTPSEPATTAGAITPDYAPQFHLFPNQPRSISTGSGLVNLPSITRDRSATNSSGTPSSLHDSIFRAPSVTSNPSSTISTQVMGRPDKKNNYFGFCKGAWTIREDWRKGLVVQVLPTGMYGQQHVWQCKACSYRGKLFGEKKPYATDPKVYEDVETSVQYRWIFLAKCHAKVKHGQKDGLSGYACLLCSLENVPSGVYGSEATLFRHVLDQHAAMSEQAAGRARCIVGRKAEPKEDFDINIP